MQFVGRLFQIVNSIVCLRQPEREVLIADSNDEACENELVENVRVHVSTVFG